VSCKWLNEENRENDLPNFWDQRTSSKVRNEDEADANTIAKKRDWRNVRKEKLKQVDS
jgi:hypothetical protein